MFQHLNSLFLALTLSLSSLAIALPNDRYQPINIEADTANFDEQKGTAIYSGNVLLTQGSMKLKANKISVALSKTTQKPIKITAIGKPASLEQKPKIDTEKVYASANTISYLIENEKITLTGDAKLKQGLSQISSDSIEYLAKEQLFKASQQENTDTKPSRVHVTLPAPKQQNENKAEQ